MSIRDVAAAAGVSVGTVSNVLNRPDVVAPATRERVLAAIEDLGFVRNEPARHLRAGASRIIGLVVLDVSNPFFTDVARGVEDAASAAGLSVIVCNSDDHDEKEERYLALLAEQRVQGVLITPVDGGHGEERLRGLRDRGLRVVLLDAPATGADFCSVSVDDVAGGRLALEHLLEQGHERIAFVGGGSRTRQVADRVQGAREALAAAGAAQEALDVVGVEALNVAGGRAAGARIAGLSPSRRPTAAFCANDLVALGLLQEMTRLGVRVPQELAIVGYDDIEFAEAAAVPLSSVRQPRHQLGRTAADLLVEESAQPRGHRHRQVLFTPELVVRDSSAPRYRRRSRGPGRGRSGIPQPAPASDAASRGTAAAGGARGD